MLKIFTRFWFCKKNIKKNKDYNDKLIEFGGDKIFCHLTKKVFLLPDFVQQNEVLMGHSWFLPRKIFFKTILFRIILESLRGFRGFDHLKTALKTASPAGNYKYRNGVVSPGFTKNKWKNYVKKREKKFVQNCKI